MYDYLAKIILLGPSGSGKYAQTHVHSVASTVLTKIHRSCLLHRFVKNEWRVLTSQTIGVEFASKIIKVGTGNRRKRIKLQVCWLPKIMKQELIVPSSGIQQAQNDSAPSHDPTIAALLALSWSMI